jgi:rhodanese-related sulfurtransferase
MIPGSRHIPVDRLPEALKKASVKKDSAIVVYCGSHKCPASKTAAEQLEAGGFTNVTKFEGGIEEWKKAGYALSVCETGACCETAEKKQACCS